MIEKAVIQFLLGTPTPADQARAAMQASVAAAFQGRWNPGKAPQAPAGGPTYPYGVVAKQGASHGRGMQGRSGTCKSSLRVEIYHPLYGTAERLADQVRQLLDGYRGWMGPQGGGGFNVQGCFQDDDSNQWQQPVHSDEQGVEAVEIHLSVAHPEN